MQLEFAMLADAVVPTADNKIIIQGANVDTVRSTSYPAVHTSLAFVAMFAQDASDEPDTLHDLRIETKNPLGEEWLPAVRGKIATPFSHEDHPGKSTAVLSLTMVLFPMKGRYVFHIFVDNVLVRNLYLYATDAPQASTPTTSNQSISSEAK